MIQTNLFTEQKQTHTNLENELRLQAGERMEGRDSRGGWDGYVHSAVFKMDNQQGITV